MNTEIRSDIQPELDQLYDKAYHMLGTDPRETMAIACMLYDESLARGYARGQALARYAGGFAHFSLGEYSRAVESFTEGDALASIPGLEDVAVKFRNGFGVVYFHLGRLDDSVRHYMAGLESARHLGLEHDICNLLINLSINYTKSGNDAQALELLDEARVHAASLKSDTSTIFANFNYGEAMLLAGRTDEAESAFRLCLELANKNGKTINQVEALVRLGSIRAERGEPVEGLAMIDEALAIGERSGYQRELVEALLAASKIGRNMGNPEKACLHSARAVEIADSRSIHSLLPEALEENAAAENAAGRFKKAYGLLRASVLAGQAWTAAEKNRQVIELETVYRLEAAKKEARLERQQREMIQSAHERLAIVTRIGKSLAASLKPGEIMSRLWEGLHETVGIISLGLGNLSPDGRSIEFSSWIENGSFVAPCAISVDNEASFVARCVREGVQLYFRTSHDWEAALAGKEALSFGKNTMPESILYLPLVRNDVVTGVLTLQSMKPDAWSQEVIDMITAISAFASIAADNSAILAKLDTINRVVQKEKEAIEKVALHNSYKAEHDTLTGLPNRVLLDRILEELAAAGTNAGDGTAGANGNFTGIIYLDLDGFKDINDKYGHDAGDRTLIMVAERLKSTLRAGDHIARVGGDEFILVVPGLATRDNIPRIMEKLSLSFSVPIALDEGDMDIRFSAGVSLFPLDGSEFKNLVRYADEAMYRVKRGSKNGWSFWSDTDRTGRARTD